MLPPPLRATSNNPDAILMFAADAPAVRTMETLVDLGVETELYMVGSCAAPAILEEAGDAAEGAIFSIEGPFTEMDTGVSDGPIYFEAAERYGPDGYEAPGAGTVSFRAIMNLVGRHERDRGENLTSQAIIDWLANGPTSRRSTATPTPATASRCPTSPPSVPPSRC